MIVPCNSCKHMYSCESIDINTTHCDKYQKQNMNIPDKVKIGGHTYKVLKDYVFIDGNNLAGQADHNKLEMKLIGKLSTGEPIPVSRKIETFIHELLHCIDNTYNSASLTEEQTERMSEGIFQVLNDNFLITSGLFIDSGSFKGKGE